MADMGVAKVHDRTLGPGLALTEQYLDAWAWIPGLAESDEFGRVQAPQAFSGDIDCRVEGAERSQSRVAEKRSGFRKGDLVDGAALGVNLGRK